jgi:hypothetical protein
MKKLLLVALAIVFALFAFVSLKLLDVGFLIDDARMETRHQREHALLLRSLLKHSVQGRSRDDVLKLFVDDLPGDHVVSNDEGRVEIGGVIFLLKDGAVVDVRLVDE